MLVVEDGGRNGAHRCRRLREDDAAATETLELGGYIVDAETGDVVEPEDQVRGYEIGKGQHILIEDDEISAIAIESSHTIEIDSFVPRSQIDQRFFDTPITSSRASRSDRRPLRSFARPCAARGWWRSGGWCCRSASG